MAFQPFPRHTTINGLEETAPRTAARASPGMNFNLPHPRKQNVRVIGIHRQIGAARVFVHEKNPLPILSAVRRAIHAALLLWSVGVPERTRENNVGISRVHDHVCDAAGFLQTHQRPGFSGIHRLVNSLSDRNMAADIGLARSRPHDARIAGCNGQSSDGRNRLRIENRLPMDSTISRFENPTRRRANVIDICVSRKARHRDCAIANGPDIPVPNLLVYIWADLGFL